MELCQKETPAREVVDLTQLSNVGIERLAPTPAQPDSCTWPFGYPTNRWGEALDQGRVIVFTDGACQGNQFRQLRIAGYGAFWGLEHPFNISEVLPGDEQTNNRAELVAVLQVLELKHCGNASPVSSPYGTTLSTL